MGALIVLSSPIWLSFIFCALFHKMGTTCLVVGSIILSIPHILLIGAMGVMLFDAPGADKNPATWIYYLAIVFLSPLLAIVMSANFITDK